MSAAVLVFDGMCLLFIFRVRNWDQIAAVFSDIS
jgi:hypothetical protein